MIGEGIERVLDGWQLGDLPSIPRLSQLQIVAALFVAKDGPYFNVPGVDPWDESRDARTYAGPHPVVAHPDCSRWGRYWSGGPNPNAKRRKLGDDGGHFKFALNAVRTYGGVLEHPAHSKAWAHFGLTAPPRDGHWIYAEQPGITQGIRDLREILRAREKGRLDEYRAAHPFFCGFTCHVEQGHYGHKARKATWLYAVSPKAGARLFKFLDLIPELRWGPSGKRARLDCGFHSREERQRAKRSGLLRRHESSRLTAMENLYTPTEFRDLLIQIARSV